MELDRCVLNGVRTNGCYSLLNRLEQECLRNSQVLKDSSLSYLPHDMRLDMFEDFQRDRMSGNTLGRQFQTMQSGNMPVPLALLLVLALKLVSPQRLQLQVAIKDRHVSLLQLGSEVVNHCILIPDFLNKCLFGAFKLFVEFLVNQFQSCPFNLKILQSKQQYSIIATHSTFQLDLVLLYQLIFLLGIYLALHQSQGFLEQLHLHPFMGRLQLFVQGLNTLLQDLHLFLQSAILSFQYYQLAFSFESGIGIYRGLEFLKLADSEQVLLIPWFSSIGTNGAWVQQSFRSSVQLFSGVLQRCCFD